MEDSYSNTTVDCDGDNDEDDDQYFEALDDFPFYDCTDSDENNQSISPSSSVSQLHPIKGSDSDPDLHKLKLRRRRTFSRHSRSDISESSGNFNDFIAKSAVSSGFADARLADSAKKFKFLRNLKDNERSSDDSRLLCDAEFENFDTSNADTKENSVITYEDNEKHNVSTSELSERNEKSEITGESKRVDLQVSGVDNNVMSSLASFVIKAIGFQVNLLFKLVTLPVRLMYSVYMFVVDPFRILRRCKDFVIGKLVKVVGGIYNRISPMVYKWFKEHNYVWKLGFRFGWGLLWSYYVCFVLVSALVSAFVISGLVIGLLVDEPVHMKETLNFDYTKPSPVAFVPLIACPDDSCGSNCREKIDTGKLGGSRVISYNHKIQVTVSLTLPESDYNRALGIFQVRVDLLSTDGSALSSLRQHSMLHFRSEPIRLLLTMFKIGPLLTGFYSETQVLKIRFRGFTEKYIPTSCIKVIIEQRAEFKSGAGIPEVYDASLLLESELPLLRRIVWYWKKTIFIWLSMTIFTVELLFALFCCSPLILPRTTRRGNNSNIDPPQNASPLQM